MLKARIITALVLLPFALLVLFVFTQHAFNWFLGAVVCIAAWEWSRLAGLRSISSQLLYAASFIVMLPLSFALAQVSMWLIWLPALLFWGAALWMVTQYPQKCAWESLLSRLIIGYLVLLPCWVSLSYIKGLSQNHIVLLFLLLIVWGADIGAYFSGRRFGRVKLAINVSPGKTREGVYGGMLVSLLVGLLIVFLLPQPLSFLQGLGVVVLSLVICLISVLGDLFESMFKRASGYKDSSQLLPGHGGILDRIDSLTAAAPLFSLGISLLAVAG